MELKTEAWEFLQQWQEQSNRKVRLALFGQPGAGKSSLINELLGQKAAAVGVQTDTTQQAQIIEDKELILVDLPGYATSEFPANAYFTTFNPLQYDLFLCVFSGKLTETDRDFFRRLTTLHRPCIFVRNKADSLYDPQLSLKELKAAIVSDVAAQLQAKVPVIFTSCKKNKPANQRGIDQLQTAIAQHLEPALQDKFLRSAKAYTAEVLALKKAAAAGAIKKAMLLAAGNGLNPLFLVDTGIDLKILHAMYSKIRATFAISEEEIEGNLGKSPLVTKIALGLKKETIVQGLKRVMSESMEKKLAKYIPAIGQLAAMGAGAGGMYYLGMEYLEDCYAYAAERLEAEIKMRAY